jgi:diguanylate cyclase (GGDEF)-like protein
MSQRGHFILRCGAAAAALAALSIVATALVNTHNRTDGSLLAHNSRLATIQLSQALIVSDDFASSRITRFEALSRVFDVELSRATALTKPRSTNRSLLASEGKTSIEWQTASLRVIVSPTGIRRSDVIKRRALSAEFGRTNAALQKRLLNDRSDAKHDESRVKTAFILLALVLFAAIGGTTLIRRLRLRAARIADERRLLQDDRRHRRDQEEFTGALQGARSEREAQRMLKRQLERALEKCHATVLNRNNSGNRLEAVTTIPASSPLANALPDAEPGDCLSVRFGRTYERAVGSAPLLACELCGGLPGSVTCVPSLVGGEVIGSVLVETPEPLGGNEHRRLADGVAHAAPVLASMRNLRLAETQASTDLLTGLANRRAAESTFNLLLANAGRSQLACAVVMMDIDHFKKVNDVYGHEKGDEVLAAVGALLGSSIRTSDIAARFGGEEFLLVLSDTEFEASLAVCEKLRAGVEELRVLGGGKGVTASFGMAMFPQDAIEPEALLRAADRALYAAKAAGRNCVKALQLIDGETGLDVDVSPATDQAGLHDANPPAVVALNRSR